jgi:hypothetical protein
VAPPPPAKSGGGIGVFILIAIIAALIAMSSSRARRPRMAPPPQRYYQKLPAGERLNSIPWPVERERRAQGDAQWPYLRWPEVDLKPRAPTVGERLWSSLHHNPPAAAKQNRSRESRSKSASDDVVDRIIRRASEYLARIEADRGAVHKSGQAPDAGSLP